MSSDLSCGWLKDFLKLSSEGWPEADATGCFCFIEVLMILILSLSVSDLQFMI